MSEQNGGGPTLAAEAVRRLTTVVRAPRSGIDLLIRRIADYELLEATEELPTSMMDREKALEFFSSMSAEGKFQYLRKAERADERIIMAAVLAPRVVQEYDGQQGAVPVSLLRQDRVFLVGKIIEFSRLTPELPAEVPAPGPSEVPAGAPFPSCVGDPPGVLAGAGAPDQPGPPVGS